MPSKQPRWTEPPSPEELAAQRGWKLHQSGQWIKVGLARIEPLPGGRWLSPVGVFDNPHDAMQACEDRADEVRAFKGVW